MQPCRQTRGSSGSVCFIADSDTLKPENVLHYTFTLGSEVCSHCLMDPHSTGQQGVALLLRLTSTRLFLAEDLLTAHLTLWSAHERQLTVADSWNTPSPHFPIRYLIDCLHLMRTSTNFQMTKPEKSLVGGYIKRYHEGNGWFPASSWKPVGAAAVYRSLIYDLLSFACVFTGFWELHSIRAAGVRSMFFCEDKLKLDTFISASAAEEPVTAYQKSFSLITRLKVWEIVTVPDKWKGEKKSKGTQNVYKAQS